MRCGQPCRPYSESSQTWCNIQQLWLWASKTDKMQDTFHIPGARNYKFEPAVITLCILTPKYGQQDRRQHTHIFNLSTKFTKSFKISISKHKLLTEITFTKVSKEVGACGTRLASSPSWCWRKKKVAIVCCFMNDPTALFICDWSNVSRDVICQNKIISLVIRFQS